MRTISTAPYCIAMDTYHYTTYDGRDVVLEWSNDEMTAWTADEPRERIGSFEFQFVEGSGGRGDDDYYHVTNMHLEGPSSAPGTYQQQGIGREILQIVGHVTFSPHDGIRRDDGSHLTGVGPIFAAKMVAAGLASWSSGGDGDFDWED